MTKTFCIIKPDVFSKTEITSQILQRLDTAGFKVTQFQVRTMPKEQAELFYNEHEGKPFFKSNVTFMSSGPCLGLILTLKDGDAITVLRNLIGNTNPQKADEGTIRSDFGSELPKNAIHASDSEESFEEEVYIFFDYELRVLLGDYYPPEEENEEDSKD